MKNEGEFLICLKESGYDLTSLFTQNDTKTKRKNRTVSAVFLIAEKGLEPAISE